MEGKASAQVRAVIERAFADDDSVGAAWDAAGALAGDLERIERGAGSPAEALVELVRALGEAGLLSLVVPARHGGRFDEVRSVALCLARERLAWISPLADLAFAMQGLGSFPITSRGSDALRGEWLPRVARGAVVAVFALTEPEAGSDLGGIATTARRDGDGYVLDGEKVFISNAGVAGLYTLFAATAPPGERRRLSAFAVPADAPGLEAEPMQVLGGHPIGRLRLSGMRVPESSRIGQEGDGMSVALGTLHRFRPTVGAAAVGFAQRALDETVAHVRARRQFEAPLADLQAVQMRVADMACDIEAARLLVYRAARAADDGAPREEVGRTGSIAKLVATENAQRVIDQAVQLHGGRGGARRLGGGAALRGRALPAHLRGRERRAAPADRPGAVARSMSDWLAALGERGGPLVDAARRFLREHAGAPDAPPRGAAALARLADALEAWCEIEDPGEEADRRFVEGAGALLGLVLIDHVGEGGHAARGGAHRVRLGPRGWFDPFGAVAEALDAEDPRGAIAAAVREAEAEARDAGRLSRVLLAFERALSEELPGTHIAESFEHYVRLGPDVEVDLARVVAATDGQGEDAVDQAVRRLVTMLPGARGAAATSWDEACDRLVPRLLSAAFLEELRASHGDRGELWTEPLGHDVHVALLLAYEGRARYVRRDEVDAWAVAPGEPRAAAVANLARRSAAARFARVDTPEGPIVVARTGDGLDAARLILPALHDVLAPELGSPFLAAVPHRDTLLACARGPAALVAALRARAADDAARAPHRISPALFEIHPSTIRTGSE